LDINIFEKNFIKRKDFVMSKKNAGIAPLIITSNVKVNNVDTIIVNCK
jgi:hypothetical protein